MEAQWDVVIVGSGLSGLSAAKSLKTSAPHARVLILEALPRVGGRTMAPSGFDLGACWTWPAHDRNLGALLKDLGFSSSDFISQTMLGYSLYEASRGQITNIAAASPSGEGSFRISGGMGSICPRIVKQLDLNIVLSQRVRCISSDLDCKQLSISTDSGELYYTKACILAAPPQDIAQSIRFSPPLSTQLQQVLLETPTWMKNAAKLCLHYREKFWARQGCNGTFFSTCGPVVQGWDNSDFVPLTTSTPERASYTLCFFIFDANRRYLGSGVQDRAVTLTDLEPLLAQLQRAYGSQLRDYTHIELRSWANHDVDMTYSHEHGFQRLKDTKSGTFEQESKSRVERGSLPFGHPLLRSSHLFGRLYFAGTETVQNESGHMEGAIIGGQRAVRLLLDSGILSAAPVMNELAFPVGARVQLFNLMTASLNGVIGVVTIGLIDGRVGVDLGEQGVKSIKVANLRAAPAAT
jgi:monoamine oxidase